jgi:hypothetical protein
VLSRKLPILARAFILQASNHCELHGVWRLERTHIVRNLVFERCGQNRLLVARPILLSSLWNFRTS